MATLTRGTVRSYDALSHRASVQVAGSLAVWVDGVAVASGIPAADVVVGRECAVLFFTDDNPDDAVVLTMHGAAPGPGGWRRVIDADGDTYVHTELSADEDRVRTVIAGVLRTLVQGTSPEFQVTGDAQFSGGLGLRGTAPSASIGINADWTATAVATPDLVRGILRAPDATSGARGVTGEVQIPAANANALSYVRGLEFKANHAGAGHSHGPRRRAGVGRGHGPGDEPDGRVLPGLEAHPDRHAPGRRPLAPRAHRLRDDARLRRLPQRRPGAAGHDHRLRITCALTDITLAGGAVLTNHYGVRVGPLTFGTGTPPLLGRRHRRARPATPPATASAPTPPSAPSPRPTSSAPATASSTSPTPRSPRRPTRRAAASSTPPPAR